MTFTYVQPIATDRDRVRLLIPDRDPDAVIFEDDEIEAFLAIEIDVRLAAAQALETIASNEVYQLKAIKAGTVALDGPATAKGILARATMLREQVAFGYAADGRYFDIAETVTGPFGYRERVLNERLREA